ncbi:MAG TPA: glycosyltransferase family 9 protein [Candidatus Methylacidiphilales bacterium]|nr:glycosyltransferase family 9 protein [Candidatus Methylacidiphilales bacterium]
MNVPGLDTAWILGHRALRGVGVVRPWTLPECKSALAEGCPVLVVATTALGDSILCTPLLDTLSTHLGPERTFFWVREPFRTLYNSDPRIGGVFGARGKYRGLGVARSEMRAAMSLDGNALKKKGSANGAAERGFIALIANCSEPDVIPWLWWCGARGFLRYRSRWSTWGNWFANRAEMRQPHEEGYATGHAIANNLAMAQSLDMEPSTHRLRIQLKNREAETFGVLGTSNVSQASTTNDRSDSPLILIHPGASRQDKCWPLECWAEVAQELYKHAFLMGKPLPRFAVTGGKDERDAAETLRRILPGQAESHAGKLNLPELAALQQKAQLFLSGDTGPYHLAVAVGCRTVTLFAPRDRGSSTEACGLHQADRSRHAEIQTPNYGDPIASIRSDTVRTEALRIVGALV